MPPKDQYDIASFISNNRAAIVSELTPIMQQHIKKLEDMSHTQFEDKMIDMLVNSIRKLVISNSLLTYEEAACIIDLDFLTSITGDYFFNLEIYDYKNQN